MKTKRWTALLLLTTLATAQGLWCGENAYRQAMPGYRYEFPRDYFNHPEFQTEWWYYTGNVRAADGHRFGFELTFFRRGVERSATPAETWDLRDIWLAHLALSDIDGHHFFYTERINRTGAGLAGASLAERRIWNGNWGARWNDAFGEQQLTGVAPDFRFQLALTAEKNPVIHGVDGISRKAAGEGKASHYISLTRLRTAGNITAGGRSYAVEGLSWMDHEFFTHQLEPGQTGWDWFSIQLDDGSELMLFRLRRKDGSEDPFSAGTFIDARGQARRLASTDFRVIPGKTWTSPRTGGTYPIEWTIQAPLLRLELKLSTALPEQELAGKGQGATQYWEGAVELRGTNAGRACQGAGYLEMTGYAGPVQL